MTQELLAISFEQTVTFGVVRKSYRAEQSVTQTCLQWVKMRIEICFIDFANYLYSQKNGEMLL